MSAVLDFPTVREAANDESAERANNKNRRVCFGNDCAWQTQKQPEDESDKPTRPGRQLHQGDYQSDAESTKKSPEHDALRSV